jgi:hypothetical protein
MPRAKENRPEINLNNRLKETLLKLEKDYEKHITSMKQGGPIQLGQEPYEVIWRKKIEKVFNLYMKEMNLGFEFKNVSQEVDSLVEVLEKEQQQHQIQDQKLEGDYNNFIHQAKNFAERINNFYKEIDKTILTIERNVEERLKGKEIRKKDFTKPLKLAAQAVLVAAVGAACGAAVLFGGFITLGIAFPAGGIILSLVGMFAKQIAVAGVAMGGAAGLAAGVTDFVSGIKEYYFDFDKNFERALHTEASNLNQAAEILMGDKERFADRLSKVKTVIEPKVKEDGYVKTLINKTAEKKAATENGGPVRN